MGSSRMVDGAGPGGRTRDAVDRPLASAGGGLLDRRSVLRAAFLVAVAPAAHAAAPASEAERPPWMRAPGRPMSGYGAVAPAEQGVRRRVFEEYPDAVRGAGVSLTPLESLRGTITPGGLHFERHHSGVPRIDPERHRLLIHGGVRRALSFGMEELLRYPLVSRIAFLECSGNSFLNTQAEPRPATAGEIHGLVSGSEWTGVPLATLLDEVGPLPEMRWVIAEGADAASMVRSIPIEKARDDAMIALYQNGERLRPEQGYPVRLFLPGWEGNTSVKWLRRLKLRAEPVHGREETSKYSDLLPDGRSRQFTFTMGVKSVILSPSGGFSLPGPGLYWIDGIAWSGAGRVRRVRVSADGGRSWAEAELQRPVLGKSLTRFRIPWEWKGDPQRLLSRAEDERGDVQPDRADWVSRYAPGHVYHNNAVQTWKVDRDGRVSNDYA